MSQPARERPGYALYRLAWGGLDWLFPPVCGGCGQRGWRWCPDCEHKTQVISPPVCEICGSPCKQPGLCRDCQERPHRFNALRSWAAFDGPLRLALHKLKYKGDLALGEVLARPMLSLFKKASWRVDLITPVPMGAARRLERGFNQAALLALPLALGSGIPNRPGALTKSRETRSQVGLSVEERKQNVAGAFQANPKLVAGKQVLVVDDVTTTGATLDACATACLAAGAVEVFGLTLARVV